MADFKVFTGFFIVGLQNITVVTSVICNVILVQYHTNLIPEFIVIAGAIGGGSTIFLVMIYRKMGEINEMSKSVTGSWKRGAGRGDTTTGRRRLDKIEIKKCVKSFPTFKVQLGSLGIFTRGNCTGIIRKLTVYTVKVVIFARKFK